MGQIRPVTSKALGSGRRQMADRSMWRGARAPTLEDLEILAAEAWESLPDHFRQMSSDVVVRVEDFATEEVLSELGIESPFDLMGLYQGVSIDRRSFSDLPRQPDMVFLYRRAILDYWADSDETLGDIVTHVLVHEIGHHFGFSDEDMHRIEAQAKS
jgi:predicted Zn-dependent protease with MMP-like domain